MKMRKMMVDNRIRGSYSIDVFGEIVRVQLETAATSEVKQTKPVVHKQGIDVEDFIYGPLKFKGTIGGRML